eukprot:1697020-Amphidinium_carterae.1
MGPQALKPRSYSHLPPSATVCSCRSNMLPFAGDRASQAMTCIAKHITSSAALALKTESRHKKHKSERVGNGRASSCAPCQV